MAAALIALGSNLGDRARTLDEAVARLDSLPEVKVVFRSSWRATRPVGGRQGQGEFLNGAVFVDTSLTPEALFATLEQIEAAAGRTRDERWGPRTLDLDLLLFEQEVIDTPNLVVPHPRMSFRRFVLEPAAEIVPEMRHPTIRATIDELCNRVRTRGPYVAAITGVRAAERTALATAVAAAVAGRVICDPEPLDLDVGSIAERFARSGPIPVEWLERRARPISMIGWTSDAFMVISDYWFGEVSFTLMGGVDRIREYVDRFRELAASVSEPKLLVVIDPPGTAPLSIMALTHKVRRLPARPESRLPGPPAAEGELLRRSIAERWRGPLLRVDGAQLGHARDEVVAAIHAMQ